MTRLDSVPSRPCAWIVFSATIVLESEMRAPNQIAAWRGQPRAAASPAPSAVVRAICRTAPPNATARTGARSRNDSSRPSEKSRSATPSSASCSMLPALATVRPVVNRPISTPARM